MPEGIYADTSTFPKAAATPYDPLGTIGKLQGIEANRIGIDQKQLQLVNERWDFTSKVLGSLLNKPGLNGQDMQDMFTYLHKNNVLTDEQLAKELSSIKTMQTVKRQYPNASPQEQQQILSQMLMADVKQHQLAGATKVEQANGAYGSNPRMTDTGNALVPTNDLNNVPRAVGQPVPKQLPVETPTFHEPEGKPPYMAPAGASSFPVIPPGQFPGQNVPQSRLPTTGPMANPNAPMVPTRVPTVAAPPLPSNLGPEVNPRRNAAGQPNNLTGPETPRFGSPPMGLPESIESGQKQYAAATEQAGRTLQSLKSAQQAVKLMNPDVIKGITGTGPIAGKVTEALSALQGIGFTTKGTDRVAQRQELVKKLAQYLKNSPSGQRSDAAQELAAKANADANVQNLKALVDITRDNIALDRVDAAKALTFQRGEKNKRYNEFAEHQGNFPNTIDERAFKLDTMSDEERNKFLDDVEKESPAKRKKFKESYDLAKKLGMM